jgi:hypothetical protein
MDYLGKRYFVFELDNGEIVFTEYVEFLH